MLCLAQAGWAGALRQWHWIPAGSQPSPCTRSTRTGSGKGPPLTRQRLNRGWDIPTHPLAWLGADLCSGWHQQCQWPRLSRQSSLLERSQEESRWTSSLSTAAKTPRELHRGAWPGVAVVGPSPSTQPETVIPSSSSSLTLYALITAPLTLLIVFPFPAQKEQGGKDSTYCPAGPSRRFLKW